jgi:hypothetical protein
MNAPLPNPSRFPPSTIAGDWVHDRLTEARGVLAENDRHPNSLVILAARVVAGHTDDARECSDALDLLQRLDRRPLHVIAAAAFPNGGAP